MTTRARQALAGVAAALLAVAPTFAGAEETIAPPPLPLSAERAAHFEAHPEELKAILDALPRRPADAPVVPPAPTVTRNSWAQVVNAAPESGLSNPLLLPDGSVMVHVQCSPRWYRLRPNRYGDYIRGYWRPTAPMPDGHTPLYFASQVLSDGRVIVSGGLYNEGCAAVSTNKSAIYDPTKNTWITVAPPSGWATIGKAPSVMLYNGRYMLGNALTKEQAILDPRTMSWTATGTNKFDINDGEGWALMVTDKLLTTDAYRGTGTCGRNTEAYAPRTGAWRIAGGITPRVYMSDCQIGAKTYEVGPIVTWPNEQTVAFSGVTYREAHAAVYNALTDIWSGTVLQIPTIDRQTYHVGASPAMVLPTKHILIAASPGVFQSPTHYFLLRLPDRPIQIPDAPNAASTSSYMVNFVLLPTGQALSTDFTNRVSIYTPPIGPIDAYRPQVTSMPTDLTRGAAYAFAGFGLNGVSHSNTGSGRQAATNFPLVRIRNIATNRRVYCRTRGFSHRSINPERSSTATLIVPLSAETGPSELEVVANGVPSEIINVTIH